MVYDIQQSVRLRVTVINNDEHLLVYKIHTRFDGSITLLSARTVRLAVMSFGEVDTYVNVGA